MWSSIDNSTVARFIENYDFKISKSEIWLSLVKLFRFFFFLTTLNIYKAYFKSRHIRIQRQRYLFSLCEVTTFVCHRVLLLSASWFSLLMKWRILQPTTSIQVAGVSHVLGSVQRVSHKLEVCTSKEEKAASRSSLIGY